MEWRKDPNLHYTDLCIYIDNNVSKIIEPGKYPEIEDRIYNNLWLVVKALAIKKCMFSNFSDYDPYAFYAANRLFFALRKNQLNQGKTIKGKVIKPIKSCLNYMKALLYPMKIEYQNEAYQEIISEEFVSKKFDSYTFREQLRTSVKESPEVLAQFKNYLASSFSSINLLLDKVLKRSPFNPNSLDYKKLKMSLIINAYNSVKFKKKLDADPTSIVLWKLPKSMTSYVRVLLKEFYVEIKTEIMDCHNAVAVSDEMADRVLQSMNWEVANSYEE